MRDYFDASDSRNFCSLTKEAKQYSSTDANALREHYISKGELRIIGCYLLGGLAAWVYRFVTAEPKYDKIVKK